MPKDLEKAVRRLCASCRRRGVPPHMALGLIILSFMHEGGFGEGIAMELRHEVLVAATNFALDCMTKADEKTK